MAEIPDDFSFQDPIQRPGCSEGKPMQPLPRTSVDTTKRLSALRSVMSNMSLYKGGGIQAYIVPSTDAHQSEDVAPQHQRREYISGFSGSHGSAIITRTKAALWTDGRYFLQADMELDCNWILQREGIKGTPTQSQWLVQNLPKGSKVGVDPFLISICEWDRMLKELKQKNIELIPVQQNLVDLIWPDRPNPAPRKLIVLDTFYSGKSWQDKILALRETLKARSATAVVLEKLDEIAWLLNLRGFDTKYTPVFFSYAAVTDNSVTLFVDLSKVTPRVKAHLKGDQCPNEKLICVLLKPYDAITEVVKRLAHYKHAQILVSTTSSHGIRMNIPKDKLLIDESPIALPKAIKNPTEVRGMKNANLKDCVALCEFFAWIEHEVSMKSTELTELTAETKLLYFRKLQDKFISPSFATISGFGSNSAIIHYKSNQYTNAKINNSGIYLLDSGGQYLDGTTDTTRTVHFGVPTKHQKDCYTRVLKGHIDIANAVFPNDTYGRTLDVFAREPLWKVGLDYRHGTGHGIGHFLNIHEGPQCIAPGFPIEDEKILMPGMILSDEPGYYEDGKFGIRLETAVLVKTANTTYHFDGLDYLQFEPVTFIPFQRKLIDVSMLSKSQVDWLNRYHTRTREVIGPELRGKKTALDWLLKETETIIY
ncbi:Xaa-Pro aminopeptidase 1 [Desmophyllum pertusum]|uniref:Xaa-Pro aminopeptidase 1 n=1 Tax=Desmophyllum pertusum TaxID=174260 RepID=A0A9X0DDF3_9CNID|nr:Xaa-Pro aminopeptidase 1 [Desmophyllum pertusum]